MIIEFDNLKMILFIFSYSIIFTLSDIFGYFFVFITHYVCKCIGTKHLGKILNWTKFFVGLNYSSGIIFVTSKKFHRHFLSDKVHVIWTCSFIELIFLQFISRIFWEIRPSFLFFYNFQEMYKNGELVIIPHVKFGFILLVILALSLIVFGAARFRLNKYLGATFVVFYIMFVAYAYIQDLFCNSSCWIRTCYLFGGGEEKRNYCVQFFFFESVIY